MALNSLHDLYVEELKDLYNAENQLVKALPQMAKKATAPELKSAFNDHLQVSHQQIERLEKIFTEMNVSPKGKKCKAMEGLVAEGKEVLEEKGETAVIDAALIAMAQRVEHYEIAGYGCVRTFANLLGYKEAATLLQETLDEEGEADKKLTELAETVINVKADEANDADEPDDETEDDDDGDLQADDEDEDEVDDDEEMDEEEEQVAKKGTMTKTATKPKK